MASNNKARISAVADELRLIPKTQDSPADRMAFAGRLLNEALNAGAFDGDQLVGFRLKVQHQAESQNVNGFVSAWCEAVWWIREKPMNGWDFEGRFSEDVALVADRIAKANTRKKRRGRKPRYDPQIDRQISEAFRASDCCSFSQFADCGAGDRWGFDAKQLKNACERHRKRNPVK